MQTAAARHSSGDSAIDMPLMASNDAITVRSSAQAYELIRNLLVIRWRAVAWLRRVAVPDLQYRRDHGPPIARSECRM